MRLNRSKYLSAHLYRNAFFLMLNSVVLSGFGFLFWTLVARLYPVGEVGLATALISLLELILVFSLAGFNVSLIRYLPGSKHKKKLIGSCFIITGIIAFAAALISLGIIALSGHSLQALLGRWVYALFFVLSAVSYSLFSLTDSVLIAHRDAHWVALKSLLFSLIKLILPFLLIVFGSFGIFMSVEISAFIAFAALWIVWPIWSSLKPAFALDIAIIRQMSRFNTSNYLANIMLSAPALLMPLILVGLIGPEASAYFYYPLMIYGLISIIPSSVAQSLLAEGSHSKRSLSQKIRKSFLLSYLIIIPCVVMIFLFGKSFLSIFGNLYAQNSATLLKLLAISSLFSAGNIIYIAANNIMHKTGRVILVASLTSASIILASILLVNRGLPGIGLAWLFGHLITNLFVYSDMIISKLKSKKMQEKSR